MGLLSFFRRKALTATPEVVDAIHTGRANIGYIRLGGGATQNIRAAYERAQSATYGQIYATQPAVRTVVDVIATNVAQLGLKLYERVSDNERRGRPELPAALTMRYPNEWFPADQFIFDYMVDFLVFHNAYAVKLARPGDTPRTLVRIPPDRVTLFGDNYATDHYRVYHVDGTYADVPREAMMHWRSYNPEDPMLGLSPLETLRLVLQEDATSQAASVELMKNGLKGGHIERPLEAPEWDLEAQERFIEGWAAQVKATPSKTPVLEEGMKYVTDAITPKDAELLAGREFTLATTARLYGVPYGLFLEQSGLEESRRMFYSDVIAPLSKSLACQLDFSILGQEYDQADDFYFEFLMEEKLRGDIESRLPNLVSAAGAPIMLRDEARAILNLPPVEGGDEIVTPLNVIVGENPKPAPNVMGPQDPNKPPQDGSYRELPPSKAFEVSTAPRAERDVARQQRYIDEATALLERLYRRQLRSIRAKAFDSERWNKEFADAIHKFLVTTVALEAGLYVTRLGGLDFDMGRVANYLKAMALGIAEGLNRVTQADATDETRREALERAIGERAAVAGTSIGTRATTFARKEAALQAPNPEARLKTWIADTERHQHLDGVSVPLGSDWGGIEPGSEPNCACSVSIS